jgi:hypothetical protein
MTVSESATRKAAFAHKVHMRELEVEARHACDRYRRYRTRSYKHPSSPMRMRELGRAARQSQTRLDRARTDGLTST